MYLPKHSEENKSSRPYIKIIRVGIVIIVAVIVLEIWAVNRLATYGPKIQEIQRSQAALKMENKLLENQISESTSLMSLEQKSSHLGFNSIQNIKYLKSAGLASNF